tara:strand:- start:1044 stop:1634 length:591 start_codon:yes stop_codon:yes gene_type:complete
MAHNKGSKKENFRVTTPVPQIPDLEELSDSTLNMFDPANPDIGLFNLIDDEIIRLSGSKMMYYKYYQNADYDPVYMEARNKPIAKDPILVHGHYEPRILEENLTQFGIELTNDQIFIFNKSYIEKVLSREVIPGDVILPEFQNQKYEIIEAQEDSFEVYGVYHIVCTAKIFRDSSDMQDTPLSDVADDLSILEEDL